MRDNRRSNLISIVFECSQGSEENEEFDEDEEEDESMDTVSDRAKIKGTIESS